jgi:hypothetical protein
MWVKCYCLLLAAAPLPFRTRSPDLLSYYSGYSYSHGARSRRPLFCVCAPVVGSDNVNRTTIYCVVAVALGSAGRRRIIVCFQQCCIFHVCG